MTNGTRDSSITEVAAKRRRKLNVLIELTQALIAISITGVTLYVSGRLAIDPDTNGAQAASLLLSNAFFLVIGYYFGRHNPRPGQRVTDLNIPPTPPNGEEESH